MRHIASPIGPPLLPGFPIILSPPSYFRIGRARMFVGRVVFSFPGALVGFSEAGIIRRAEFPPSRPLLIPNLPRAAPRPIRGTVLKSVFSGAIATLLPASPPELRLDNRIDGGYRRWAPRFAR